jgi:hypothetical protein
LTSLPLLLFTVRNTLTHSLPFSYFRPTDFNTSHFNTSHEFLPCSPRWSGSCPAYMYYKYTHRGGVPGLPGVGGEPRTQHVSTHTQRTQHVQGHAKAHAQARTPPLPSSSSFPAQPPLVASRRGLTSSPGKSSVVRGAAVAASRLARGECSVVRGARWVAHVVSWKWKWYLVIFLVPKPPSLVLNRGEESV